MYLKITDGTHTIDLLGNDDFALLSEDWAPAVPRRRLNRLGGPIFNNVVEEIPLYAQAANAATVLSAIAQLNDMIDRAGRWSRREILNPVILRYSPTSDSVYYEAVIEGTIDEEPAIVLPDSFHANLYQGLVDSLVLRFVRRPFLDDEESASSSSVDQPGVMTATYSTDSELPALLAVTMGTTAQTNISGGVNGILAISGRNENDLLFEEAEDWSVDSVPGSGTFNSITDNGASGDTIRQLVPNSAGDYTIRSGTFFSWNLNYYPDDTLMAIYISVKVPASINYTVSGYMQIGESVGVIPDTVIDSSIGDPQIHFCGVVSIPYGTWGGTTYLTFTPDGTGGSSDALEIDCILRVRLTEQTRIIGVRRLGLMVSGNPHNIVIDHRTMTRPTPVIMEQDTVVPEVRNNVIFTGDLFMETRGNFYSAGDDQTAAILFATTGSAWRPVSGTTPTVLSLTLTATRQKVISVPS